MSPFKLFTKIPSCLIPIKLLNPRRTKVTTKLGDQKIRCCNVTASTHTVQECLPFA